MTTVEKKIGIIGKIVGLENEQLIDKVDDLLQEEVVVSDDLLVMTKIKSRSDVILLAISNGTQGMNPVRDVTTTHTQSFVVACLTAFPESLR